MTFRINYDQKLPRQTVWGIYSQKDHGSYEHWKSFKTRDLAIAWYRKKRIEVFQYFSWLDWYLVEVPILESIDDPIENEYSRMGQSLEEILKYEFPTEKKND